MRRTGTGLLLLGTGSAGVAATLRQTLHPGSSTHSATYLLDVLAVAMTAVGIVLEVRAAEILISAGLLRAKRRAILCAVAGLVAGLAGCWLATGLIRGDASAAAVGLASAAMAAGVGFGLAGLVSLGWSVGGDYAARRVQELGEEEW